MKKKLQFEKTKINKIIYNKNLEQQIEFEYQLPDYYTGIFKVLRFNLNPHISSCRTANNQLTIDGNAIAKLLYLDEEEGNIKSVQQSVPFSKTIEIKNLKNDSILFYDVKTKYKNCRIISPKKIEIKATLNILVKVQSQEEENILKNTTDKSLQLKQIPVTINSNQIWSSQQFNVKEQLELNTIAKNILNVKVNIFEDECKIIANKIIAKAIAQIEVLYCTKEKNTPILEKTSIPINNIIDMPKIDENFLYNIKYDVISNNFETLQEGKTIKVEANVLINCYANLCKQIDLVTDAFSTKFEINCTKKELNCSTIIATINQNSTIKQKIPNINLTKVFYVDAQILELHSNIKNDSSKIEFNAKLNLNVLGLNKDNTIEAFSKAIPIKFEIEKNNVNLNYTSVDIKQITILNVDENLNEDGDLKIKIKFNLKGFVFANGNISTITDIVLDENKTKKKSKAAITLYYPTVGDKIWDIAKQFCTSPDAILEANDLQNEIIDNETMLIIPII